jgi:hypothetical protein
MTDKELLELAAKAADLHYDPTKEGDELGRVYSDHLGLWIWHWKDWWNPLTDDGDALRLAVKLQLGISIPPVIDGRIDVVTFCGPLVSIIEYPNGDDRFAATRRAITRAAAEIGKGMK